jgi:hypothetical protein
MEICIRTNTMEIQLYCRALFCILSIENIITVKYYTYNNKEYFILQRHEERADNIKFLDKDMYYNMTKSNLQNFHEVQTADI